MKTHHVYLKTLVACIIMLVCGCGQSIDRSQSICVHGNILCKLIEVDDLGFNYSEIVIYCSGQYTWEIKTGAEQKSFSGFVLEDNLALIRKSALHHKKFNILDDVPVYKYATYDSFTPHPEGCGEFLGYLWRKHITPQKNIYY